jgi:MarR family transcriptional regulator, organic hydroperoxide resistance regulator
LQDDHLCGWPHEDISDLSGWQHKSASRGRPNEHDRRVLNVWLTERGRELRQPIEAMWAALEEISTRHVDEQAIRSFIATARTIESSITDRAAFSQETS